MAQHVPVQGNKQTTSTSKATIVVSSALLLLAVAAFAVIAVNRTELRPLGLELPSRVQPGKSLPADARCDWHMVMEHILYCNVVDSNVLVHFSYDIERQVILSSSMLANGKTVGDLLLAWGEPSGYTRSEMAVQVFWGARSVYLSSTPFKPGTRAGYITYTLEPDSARPWHGFTSVKR
jgi:hypothetical protein